MCDSVKNTPGTIAVEKMNSMNNDLIFKIPLNHSKKKKKKVLKEEIYVQV